jgi:hypothetical protein
MSNYRQFAPAAYLVGFLLFFIPFFDALMSIAPWHVGMAEWRFAAAGLVSNAFMIPASGALIAVATALTYSHFKTQLWFGILLWVMALGCVLAMLSFSLDAMQTKNVIRADMQLSFRVATITAEAKLFFGALSFALLGRACKLERWYSRWFATWLKKRTASAAAARS